MQQCSLFVIVRPRQDLLFCFIYLFLTGTVLFSLIHYRLIGIFGTLLVTRLEVQGPLYVLPVSWQPVLKPQPQSAPAERRLATRPRCEPTVFGLMLCYQRCEVRKAALYIFDYLNSWMRALRYIPPHLVGLITDVQLAAACGHTGCRMDLPEKCNW